MRINFIDNSINSNSNSNNRFQNIRSVSTPSFGARVNNDIFQKTVNSMGTHFEKGLEKYLTKDFHGDLLMHGLCGDSVYHETHLAKIKEIHKALSSEHIAQIHLTQDNWGNLPMHKATADQTIEIHRALKYQPKVIARIHLTKGLYGDLPIHYADLEKTKEIHRVLENQPKVLAQIHLTKDKYNKLPMHSAGALTMAEIHRVLENQPEIIAQIHLTRGEYNQLPMHYSDICCMEKIHRALKNQPEVLAQIHLTQDAQGNLPIHLADIEQTEEIHKVLENQPEVIAQMHLTKNKRGELPIDCHLDYHYYDDTEMSNEIYRAITNAALNSNLDTDTSIKLLETYNKAGRYDEAIQELKLAAAKNVHQNTKEGIWGGFLKSLRRWFDDLAHPTH